MPLSRMPPSQHIAQFHFHRVRSSSSVLVLESPAKNSDGEAICQCVVAETSPAHAAALALTLCKQVSAPPFNVIGASVRATHPHIIEAPWAHRGGLSRAIASLRPQIENKSDDSALRRQVDANTMASLVGLGAVLFRHISPVRRRLWRFSQFSLVETFTITSVKWRAFDTADEFAGGSKIPFVQISGGFNSAAERRHMAERLKVACDVRI